MIPRAVNSLIQEQSSYSWRTRLSGTRMIPNGGEYGKT
jgi:hypothetical protein